MSEMNKFAKKVKSDKSILTSSSSSRSQSASLQDDDEVDTSDVQELFLDQRLDHFSTYPSNTNDSQPFTFAQRYFFTSRYTNTSNAKSHIRKNGKESSPTYAFICVGGEGPSMTKKVLTQHSPHCSGDMVSMASILSTERNANVYIFALEHRYYGESYPDFGHISPVTNENLRFLSSRQALEDLAHFIQFVKKEYLVDVVDDVDSVLFLTYGGSYPGMLAAWSRLKYPHLVDAAVSNSAPLQVTFEFTEYMDVYANALSNPIVGGSQECLGIIHSAHEDLASQLSAALKEDDNETLENIANMFDICGGVDSLKVEKNVNSFLGDGLVFFDVQENDPHCDGDLCSIEKFCTNITESASSSNLSNIEILARLSRAMEGGECKDISWEEMIDFLSSDEAQVGGTRSWLWQTCTEVGFYQTCVVDSSCPFARGYHKISDDLEICERAFGIENSEQIVKDNVESTLIEYGGWNIRASNILSTNGDIDPWSAKSFSNNPGKDPDDMKKNNLQSYWSIGASHHFWTHGPVGSDGFGIMRTREVIYDWILQILQGEQYTRHMENTSQRVFSSSRIE